ncbi:MAG: MauE/DoxX family redox-associated membrane protein [Pyrinomonadaceae bacterium]
MDDVFLLIRIFLFGVFSLAAVGKLLDPAGSVKAVRDFGAPESVAPAIGYALPFAEIVFAFSLLFPVYSWYGAVGASILLLTFVGGMAAQMWQGKAPDCHCFGQIHSEPVGIKSVIRNMVLLLATLFLVFRGDHGQGARITDNGRDPVFFVLLVASTLLLVVVVWYLIKISANQTKMDERVEMLEALSAGEIPKTRDEAGDPHDGLPIGAVFPDFTLGDRNNKPISLDRLLADRKPLVFFFVGPTCLPCQALMPEIAEWHTELGDKLDFVVVTNGTREENAAKLNIPYSIPVLFQEERELAESVSAKWTPTAMFVRGDGRVGSHLAAGDRAVRDLMSKLRHADLSDRFVHVTNGHSHGKPKIGKRVEEFSIDDISGRTLTAADLTGKETLAVFWSRTCPHCVNMMKGLREWDSSKGPHEPNLIVFSEGEHADHAKLGLKSPVVIDNGYETAIELGMFGTPSAVLIDEEGYIVSEAAIGSANIWSLIGRKDP